MITRISERISNWGTNPVFVFSASVASIIGLFASLWGSGGIISIIALIYAVLYSLFALFYFRKKYLQIEKIKVNIEEINYMKYKETSESLHKYFHKLRYNHASLLRKTYMETEAFESMMVNICDNIADFFTIILNCKTSVCIKRIMTEDIGDNVIDNWNIRTLGRSSSSDISRSKSDNDTIPVSKNTVYQMILDGNEDIFSSVNLEITIDKYLKDKKKPFNNPRENYSEQYKSVIVVPIRIQSKNVSKSLQCLKHNKDYHVIGFLCIDSLLVFDKNTELFGIETSFSKSFGDSLYLPLECYLINQLHTIKEESVSKDEATE